MPVFIVVAILLLLVNIFFFFSFKGIANRLSVVAKSNLLRQMEVYDILIENKEKELERVQLSIDIAQKKRNSIQTVAQEAPDDAKRNVLVNPFAVSLGTYRDKDFTKTYKKIKNTFIFDKEEYIKTIINENNDTVDQQRGNVIHSILMKFDLEMKYQFFTTEKEKQVDQLRKLLAPEETIILEEYLALKPDFEFGEFMNWIHAEVFKCNPNIVVRTGEKTDDFSYLGNNIKTEYDRGICEGIYIIKNGVMHDFSIRNGEISG